MHKHPFENCNANVYSKVIATCISATVARRLDLNEKAVRREFKNEIVDWRNKSYVRLGLQIS